MQSDFEQRQLHFSLQSPPDALWIDADENQLSQVLLNLLKNAMQAPEGRTDGTGIVCLSAMHTEGTGIGLSLCRQIIRQHGGHLIIRESRPGQTIFSIDLP